MTDYDDDSALDADIPDDDASAGGRRAPTHKGGEGGKPAKKKRARSINFGDLNRLLEHFALLYGTDTIWDGESRKIMKIGALRLAFGNDVVKMWLGSAKCSSSRFRSPKLMDLARFFFAGLPPSPPLWVGARRPPADASSSGMSASSAESSS
jgi:hypothetical protein